MTPTRKPRPFTAWKLTDGEVVVRSQEGLLASARVCQPLAASHPNTLRQSRRKCQFSRHPLGLRRERVGTEPRETYSFLTESVRSNAKVISPAHDFDYLLKCTLRALDRNVKKYPSLTFVDTHIGCEARKVP